jgi:hypothetical protein
MGSGGMRKAYFALFAIVVCLYGCASETKADQDKAACLKAADMPPMPAVSEDIDAALYHYRDCMKDRGYPQP